MLSPVKIWRNQKKIQKLLGLTAKILYWTKVYLPPVGFESNAPYIVVLVRFENGKNYIAQLVDFDKSHLTYNQNVKAVLRKTFDSGEEGVIAYGIKFKPI